MKFDDLRSRNGGLYTVYAYPLEMMTTALATLLELMPILLTRAAGFLVKGTSAAVRAVVRWHQRRKAVRELSAIDDWLLRDIGLDRGDVHALATGKVSLADLESHKNSKLSAATEPRGALVGRPVATGVAVNRRPDEYAAGFSL
jgi:uncharacterized protein YjiS (DUF1127 family)